MDLNNIELPAFVVADLYGHSLVETSLPEQETKKAIIPEERKINADQTGFKHLGNNQRFILIVVNNQEAVFLSDKELTFLTGILTACKLSLADVAIVNLNNHPDVSYKELSSFFTSRIVLLFDIEPADFGLPMSFPHYQVQPFAGNSFLYSASLTNLENDREEKLKLWTSLKRLFNL